MSARRWFVRNLRDAEWRHADRRGAVALLLDDFEGERAPIQVSVNPFLLAPGDVMSMYHWEADQEDFLVLAGEALLIVDGKQLPLRTWDFFHCPPRTPHAIVGAGTSPCLVVAVGAREHSEQRDALGFPADALAKRYGASVDDDTMDGGVAYANVPPRAPKRVRLVESADVEHDRL